MKFLSNNLYNKIAAIIIVLCLIVAIYTGVQRMNVEKNYSTVEISIDYEEMDIMSNKTDIDIEEWLSKFSELGMKSISIKEETIRSLEESGENIKTYLVANLPNADLIDYFPNGIIEDLKYKKISDNDVIVKTNSNEMYEYILEGLELRYPNELYSLYQGNNGDKYIVLFGTQDDTYYGAGEKVYNIFGKATYEKKSVVDSRLLNIGVGYSREKIERAKKLGFDVVLRPINYPRYTEKIVDAYDKEHKKYEVIPRVYMVTGSDALGNPSNLDTFAIYLKDNNISPMLIEANNQRENIEQGGILEISNKLNNRVIRGFSLWDWIRTRYKAYGYNGAEEIENSIYRAVTERNVRFVLFKPFYETNAKYVTDLDEYERTFKSLESRLSKHNITMGVAKPISSFNIGNARLGLMCLGVGIAAILLFNLMFNIKGKLALILYILSCGSALIPFVFRGLSEKAFSFGSSVVFAGLAIYYLVWAIGKVDNNEKEISTIKILCKSTVILCVTSLISLAGALFVAGILADTRYMIEIEIFRGVKLSQLLPFVIFILVMFIEYIRKLTSDDLNSKTLFSKLLDLFKKVLNYDIKVYYIVVLGILGAIGYIYIARTGHESNVQPLNIEMVFRNLLENVLVARPRTKEFLIAFPAIFCAVYASSKKIPYIKELFMLAGVIGISSIINTFCHIRTPLYLSLVRTFISVGFGIVVGVVAVFVFMGIHKLFVKIQERLN